MSFFNSLKQSLTEAAQSVNTELKNTAPKT